MGQRSQMYIAFEMKSDSKKAAENRLVAVHHQWCYGVDAVQRLEGVLDCLSSEIQTNRIGTDYPLTDDYFTAEILENAKMCSNVNFWTRDIDRHIDLIDEQVKYYLKSPFESLFLEQDNNDGQFYIKVAQDGTLKYAIVTGKDYSQTLDNTKPVSLTPVDAMRYLDDYSVEDKAKRQSENQEEYKQFFDELNECIQSIRDKAELMTPEELHEMIYADYSLELKHYGVENPKKATKKATKTKPQAERN